MYVRRAQIWKECDLENRATLRKKLHFLRAAKQNELDELCQQLPDTEPVRRECAVFTDLDGIEDCIDVYHYLSERVEMVDEAAIQTILAQPGTILFEGAQGVLLDENYGFAPYTTWSTTTFAHADTLVQEHNYPGEILRIGLLRAYATRHGAGPFPTEDRTLTLDLPDQHNSWNDWQHTFRVGYFDLVAACYARDIVGNLDYLALTNIDRLAAIPEWKISSAYSYQGEQTDLFPFFKHAYGKITEINVQRPVDLAHQEQLTQRFELCTPEYQMLPPKFGRQYTQQDRERYLLLIEEALSVPIAITSYGPTAADKEWIQARFLQPRSSY